MTFQHDDTELRFSARELRKWRRQGRWQGRAEGFVYTAIAALWVWAALHYWLGWI